MDHEWADCSVRIDRFFHRIRCQLCLAVRIMIYDCLGSVLDAEPGAHCNLSDLHLAVLGKSNLALQGIYMVETILVYRKIAGKMMK